MIAITKTECSYWIKRVVTFFEPWIMNTLFILSSEYNPRGSFSSSMGYATLLLTGKKFSGASNYSWDSMFFHGSMWSRTSLMVLRIRCLTKRAIYFLKSLSFVSILPSTKDTNSHLPRWIYLYGISCAKWHRISSLLSGETDL